MVSLRSIVGEALIWGSSVIFLCWRIRLEFQQTNKIKATINACNAIISLIIPYKWIYEVRYNIFVCVFFCVHLCFSTSIYRVFIIHFCIWINFYIISGSISGSISYKWICELRYILWSQVNISVMDFAAFEYCLWRVSTAFNSACSHHLEM